MTQKKSGAKKVAVGLGLAGLAAAGIAGAYFLYGKDGKKNKKKISSWMLKAKAEVIDQLGKAKELTRDNFDAIVDAAAAKYGSKVKDLSADDLQSYAKGLKKHWNSIKADLMPKKKPAKKKK